MKNLFQLTSLTLLYLLMGCTNTEDTSPPCDDTNTVQLSIAAQDVLTMDFPDCYTIEVLQGIDSYVGKLEATVIGVEILYDVGLLAGEYISDSSPNQITAQGQHEPFRYETMNNVLYFTFPSAGPANFWTSQIDQKDNLIKYLGSLKVN